MKLKSPQPFQSFFHVGPNGNTYHSDKHGSITPLNSDDDAALRALGCFDAPWGDGTPGAVIEDRKN